MAYYYAIDQHRWSRLTESDRDYLRSEYRWMREHGYDRIHAKGTIDRVTLLLARAIVLRRLRPVPCLLLGRGAMTPNADSVGCELGHTRKAMECPACSDSTDPAWWKWYEGRTSSPAIRQRVAEWLASPNDRSKPCPSNAESVAGVGPKGIAK